MLLARNLRSRIMNCWVDQEKGKYARIKGGYERKRVFYGGGRVPHGKSLKQRDHGDKLRIQTAGLCLSVFISLFLPEPHCFTC